MPTYSDIGLLDPIPGEADFHADILLSALAGGPVNIDSGGRTYEAAKRLADKGLVRIDNSPPATTVTLTAE